MSLPSPCLPISKPTTSSSTPFHRLEEEVRTQKGSVDQDFPRCSPDDLWAVFLQRPVYRFELWVTQMLDVIAAEEALESGTGMEQVDGNLDYNRVPPLY
ncbi:hypothetical protein FRB97_003551, partial [Tulasnella sp. 331]